MTQAIETRDLKTPARLQSEIRTALKDGKKSAWKIAAAAYELIEQKGWTELGAQSLEEWCQRPDISFEARTFRRWAGVYRELAITQALTPGLYLDLDVTVVDVVLPAIRRGDVTVGEALEDVRMMSAEQLRKKHAARANVGSDNGERHVVTDGVTAASTDTPTPAPSVEIGSGFSVPVPDDNSPTKKTQTIPPAEAAHTIPDKDERVDTRRGDLHENVGVRSGSVGRPKLTDERKHEEGDWEAVDDDEQQIPDDDVEEAREALERGDLHDEPHGLEEEAMRIVDAENINDLVLPSASAETSTIVADEDDPANHRELRPNPDPDADAEREAIDVAELERRAQARQDVRAAIAAARLALEVPQRLAGARQQVRQALTNLIDATEALLNG